MLLLLGAELSYGLSHYRRPGSGRFPVEDRLRLASLLVSARDEDSQNSELAIRRQLGDIDAGRVTNLLQEFRRKGWIVSTDNGRWAWVRNPESLSVGDFFAGQTLKHLRRANAVENSKLVKLQEWQQEFGSTFSEKLDKPLSSLLD